MPGEEALTAEARRRLEAIQDLADLGSGFRLANLDLEIRGAGNLLGKEQSGQLGAVGYETYMELLEEAVAELRGAVRPTVVDPEIRLPVAARLPEAYVPEVSQRLVLYKRLAGAADDDEVEQIRGELLDRYGPLPAEAESLLEVIRLKLLARDLAVAGVDYADGAVVLRTAAGSAVDPARLVDLLNDRALGVRLGEGQRILAAAPDKAPAALFAARALAARGARTPRARGALNGRGQGGCVNIRSGRSTSHAQANARSARPCSGRAVRCPDRERAGARGHVHAVLHRRRRRDGAVPAPEPRQEGDHGRASGPVQQQPDEAGGARSVGPGTRFSRTAGPVRAPISHTC